MLSYRSSDEEGNLALPSPFVADVRRAARPDWPERRRRRLLADVVWPPDEAPDRARAGPQPRRRAAAPRPASCRRRSARSVRGCAAPRAPPRDPVRRARSRPTRDCPVQVAGRARAPARARSSPTPSRWSAGSYMHDVLEQVLERLGGRVTPESLPRALEILDDGARRGRAADRCRAGRGASARRLRRAIEADLRRYLAHEAPTAAAWRPAALELRFGFEGEERHAAGARARRRQGRGPRARRRSTASTSTRAGRAIVRDYKSGGARPELPGRALGAPTPAPGRAVHDRRARAAGARAGRRLLPAAARRATCAPAGVFLRRTPTPATAASTTDAPRRARSSTTSSRMPRRGRWRWPRGCAPGELDARARQTCSRDGCALSRDLPQLLDDERRAGRRAVRPPSSWRRSSAARATCCSTPAPAAARPRCWSSASSRAVLEDGVDGRGDPHDHVHREGGGRAARPDPRAAARARRRRGGPRDRGRVHLDDPRLLRPGAAHARAGRRARPARSRCSTRPRPSALADAAFDAALEDAGPGRARRRRR